MVVDDCSNVLVASATCKTLNNVAQTVLFIKYKSNLFEDMFVHVARMTRFSASVSLLLPLDISPLLHPTLFENYLVSNRYFLSKCSLVDNLFLMLEKLFRSLMTAVTSKALS